MEGGKAMNSASLYTSSSYAVMIKDPTQIVKLLPPREDEQYEVIRHIRYHMERETIPYEEGERMIEMVRSPDLENMELIKVLLQQKYHVLR